MIPDAVQAQLSLARERGYLYCHGPKSQRVNTEQLWRRECLQNGNPIVVVTKHYAYRPRVLQAMIWADLCGEWWLSRRLWKALLGGMKVGYTTRHGNTILIRDIPNRETTRTVDSFLALLASARPSPEEAFDTPAALARGAARCLMVDGLEELLNESETYVIREIPNMLGHGVVFRASGPPLVGIHLERFELIDSP